VYLWRTLRLAVRGLRVYISADQGVQECHICFRYKRPPIHQFSNFFRRGLPTSLNGARAALHVVWPRPTSETLSGELDGTPPAPVVQGARLGFSPKSAKRIHVFTQPPTSAGDTCFRLDSAGHLHSSRPGKRRPRPTRPPKRQTPKSYIMRNATGKNLKRRPEGGLDQPRPSR